MLCNLEKLSLQGIELMNVSAAVAHFLNCFLYSGIITNPLQGTEDVSTYKRIKQQTCFITHLLLFIRIRITGRGRAVAVAPTLLPASTTTNGPT